MPNTITITKETTPGVPSFKFDVRYAEENDTWFLENIPEGAVLTESDIQNSFKLAKKCMPKGCALKIITI